MFARKDKNYGGSAGLIGKMEKGVDTELKVLKDHEAVNTVVFKEMEDLRTELASMQNYVKEIMAIDRELELLFKTIATCLKKTKGTTALTGRQAVGYRVRMEQAMKQIFTLEDRAKNLLKTDFNDAKMMRAVVDQLGKTQKNLRTASRSLTTFSKRVQKQTKQLGDWAVEVHNEVYSREHADYKGATDSQRERQAETARRAASSPYSVKF